MAQDYTQIAKKLDSLLSSVDLSNTSEDGVKSAPLPDGYYLCQVSECKLTESKSGNPMVSFIFETVEDGKKTIVDDDGYSQLVDAPGTADSRIYINYVLSNEMNVGFYVADMLKFQDIDTKEPFFTKEDFATTEGILEVCDMLAQGAMIYLMLQTVEKKNDAEHPTEQKAKPISWKRAAKLELI